MSEEVLMNVIEQLVADEDGARLARVSRPWSAASRTERTYRLIAVRELSLLLAAVERQGVFATGDAERAIGYLIDGDWASVRVVARSLTWGYMPDSRRRRIYRKRFAEFVSALMRYAALGEARDQEARCAS